MAYTMLLAIAVGATGQAEQAADARQREVGIWRRAFNRQAKEYRIAATDNPAKVFDLVEKPVFLWSQPVRFSQIGSVYIWVQEDGRPGAIGTIFCWKTQQANWAMTHEFHSLATEPVKTVWRGQAIWAPTEPGLQWSLLPDADPPGDSRRRQSLQIRRLSREFQAHTEGANRGRWELRLLPKPLHDYAVEEGEATKVGAVLAMCQGTDPELLLVIEARPTDRGVRWHYACGAFTDLGLVVQFRGAKVWSAPATPGGRDPGKCYWRERITSVARLPEE
jgi:hypothetical protein